jgi:hypothetical protein
MNAWYHAKSSAAKWGGEPEDYMPVHSFIDESKSILADFRHRALRHHAEGIWMAERVLGPTITNSKGVKVPVRLIAEQHVKEDLGFIPSFADWAKCISGQAWMVGEGTLVTKEI